MCRLLSAFYSLPQGSTHPGQLQPQGSTHPGQLQPLGSTHKDMLPLYLTLPTFAFWLLVNTPLWLTVQGLAVYLSLSVAGVVLNLGWAALLSI
jgi:hypothetical protein